MTLTGNATEVFGTGSSQKTLSLALGNLADPANNVPATTGLVIENGALFSLTAEAIATNWSVAGGTFNTTALVTYAAATGSGSTATPETLTLTGNATEVFGAGSSQKTLSLALGNLADAAHNVPATAGLVIENGVLYSLTAEATAANWTVAGGNFSTTALATYTAATGSGSTATPETLTLTGNATEVFGTGSSQKTLSLSLGNSADPAHNVPATTGLVIKNGALFSLTAEATATNWSVAGGTFNTTALVTYAAATGSGNTATPETLTLTGNATEIFGTGASQKSLSLSLGNLADLANNVPATSGLVIENGTLYSLGAEGTATNWSVAGGSFSTTALVTYAAASGSGSTATPETLTLTGNATEVFGTGSSQKTLSLSLGNLADPAHNVPATTGLIIEKGALFSLTAEATATNWSVAGGTFNATALVTYAAAHGSGSTAIPETLTLTGNATEVLGTGSSQKTLSLALGNVADPAHNIPATSGLVIENGVLFSLTAEATATNWTVAGGSFSTTALVTYAPASGSGSLATPETLTLTGNATEIFGTGSSQKTLSLALGNLADPANNVPATTGLVIQNGALFSLTAEATAANWSVAGGTFNTTALVTYTASNDTLTVTGNATETFGSKTLSLVLGSSANRNLNLAASAGLIITGGTISSLTAQATAQGGWALGGGTFNTTSLLTYAAATTGANATPETLTLTGSASETFGGKTLNLTLGSGGTAGLVIKNGSLFSLIAGASLTGGWTLAGGTFNLVNSTVTYDTVTDTFTLSGTATETIGSRTLTLTLGGDGTAGLVIRNGSISNLTASASLNGGWTLAGGTFSLGTAQVTYTAAAGLTPEILTLTGSATETFGSKSLLLSLGTNGTSGLVIKNGTLYSLSAGASLLGGGWSLAGGTFSDLTAVVTYTAATTGSNAKPETLTLTGTATETIGSGASAKTLSLELGSPSVAPTTTATAIPFTTGLVIQNGSVSSLSARATASNWTFAGGTFNTTAALNYLAATSSTPETLIMSGSGNVTVGGWSSLYVTFGDTVRPGLVISNGTLNSLNLTVTAANGTISLTGGASLTPYSLTFSYDSTAGYTIGGTSRINLPTLGTFNVTASGTVINNKFQNFTLSTTSSNASISMLGATFNPSNLILSYDPQTGLTFTGAGQATFALHTFDVTATGAIKANSLQSLALTLLANGDGWTIAGANFRPKSMTMTYAATPLKWTIGGTASVDFTGPVTIHTDVTMGGDFSAGQFQSFSLGLSDASAINVNASMGATGISGGLSGPFTLGYSLATQEFHIGGNSTTPLAHGNLSVTGPQLASRLNLGVDFSLDFSNSGVIDQATVRINDAALIRVTASLGSANISGSLSGPLSLTYTKATSSLSVYGSATTPLVHGTLVLSGVPGFGNTTLPVDFSLSVVADVIQQATVNVTGTATVGLSASGVTLVRASVTNPQFSYQVTTAGSRFALSGSASATLGSSSAPVATASVTLGHATTPGLVWINGQLQTADIEKFNATIGVGDVASVSLVSGTFAYDATTNHLTFAGSVNFTGFGASTGYIQVGPIDFSGGILASITLNNFNNSSIPGVVVNVPTVTVGVGLSLQTLKPIVTVTGSGTVSLVGSTSFNAVLGSATQPGMVFTPGSVYPTEAHISVWGAIAIPNILSVTIDASNKLALNYNVQTLTLSLSGSATISSPALGNSSITATLGNSTSPGISIVNGSLESLNVSVSNLSLSIGGILTASVTNPITLSYDKNSGTIAFSGGVTATLNGFESAGSLSVNLGAPGIPGVVFKNGNLTRIYATASGNLSVAGVTLAIPSSSPALIDYDGSGALPSLRLSGTASANLFNLGTFSINFGTPSNPGLVINSGVIKRFSFSASGQFNLLNIVTLNGSVGVQYNSDSAKFVLWGTLSAKIFGQDFATAAVGTSATDSGLEIQGGTLRKIHIHIDSPLTLFGVKMGQLTIDSEYVNQDVYIPAIPFLGWPAQTVHVEYLKFDGTVHLFTPDIVIKGIDFGSIDVGTIHASLFLLPNNFSRSYFEADLSFDTVIFGVFKIGVTIYFDGTVSLSFGDPINIPIDPNAPYFQSWLDLAQTYVKASNGIVDPDDVNVTAEQLAAYFASSQQAAARINDLQQSGIQTVTSGPAISITPLVKQGVGSDASNLFEYSVSLADPPTDVPVTVNYTTADVTATAAGGDYVPVSGTLTWLPGDTSPKTIVVPVNALAQAIPEKLFVVKLSNPTHASIASGVGVGDILYSHFATTTKLISSSSTAHLGDPVMLTATVTDPTGLTTPVQGKVHFFDGTRDLGAFELTNGEANLLVSDLPLGDHQIKAVYTGWQIPGYSTLASESPVISQTITPAIQTITFGTLADQTYGAGPIFLNATSSSGLPVSFSVVSGPATITGNMLTLTGAGDVVVEATQPGNDSNAAAVPVDQAFHVAKALLTFTVDDQGVAFGAPRPTLTGRFSGFVNNDGPSSVTTQPTFTVDPGNVLGSYVIHASGAFSSRYQIDYVSGTLTVGQAPSQITLTMSQPDNIVVGQSETLRAVVTNPNGTGTPTGSVTFFDNGTELATISLVNGVASIDWNAFSIGRHALTVAYLGDVDFLATSTADQTLTVSPDASVVSLSTTPGHSAYAVIVTATVSAAAPGTGMPTGTVQFLDGTTVIGTTTLTNGAASIPVGVGIVPRLTVRYLGDDNFLPGSYNGSLSASQEFGVSLTSSVTSTTTYADQLTFTANVTQIDPQAGSPKGVVQFLDGTDLLGTSSVINGVASFTVNLSHGIHGLQAVYLGDNGFAATSSTLSVSVDRAIPTLSATSVGGVYNGQSFSTTAQISGIDNVASQTLEGVGLSLDYQQLDVDGNVIADLGNVAPARAGSYQVVISFTGSADYAATSISIPFVIGRATLTVTANPNNKFYGDVASDTGSISGVASGDGITASFTSLGDASTASTGIYPITAHLSDPKHVLSNYIIKESDATLSVLGQGQRLPNLVVNISSGTYTGQPFTATATVAGTVVGIDDSPSSTLEGIGLTLDYRQLDSNGNVIADLYGTAPTQAGSYQAIAAFAGSPDYAATLTSTQFVISQTASAVPVIVPQLTAYNGSSHEATANWKGADGQVGNLTVTYVGTNGTTYTSSTTPPTEIGNYLASASFPGDANHIPSNNSAAFTISAGSTSINLSSPDVTYNTNGLITLSVTAPAGAPTPTGTVTLTVNGGSPLSALLSSDGTATFTLNSPNAGDYTLVASYAAQGNYAASSSSGTLHVNKATSTTTTSGPGSYTYDGTTHSGGSGTVKGAGGLNTTATTLTYSGDQVNAGTYYVTAHYAGDANHSPSDGAPVAITINQAIASISVTGYNVAYDGAAHTATGSATGVGSANLSSSLILTGTTHTSSGTYLGDPWTFHDPSGNYADANGTVNNSITVSLLITTQPVSTTVVAGSNVTLTAAASGTSTPTVQWQVSTNGGSTWNNVAGATSATYSFASSLAQNGNRFRAVFTNAGGTVTTDAATLIVTRPFSVLTAYTTTVFTGLNTGSINVVDFQDPLAISSPTTYTATINWGDGQIDTNVPVAHSAADGTTIHVLGSHTYATGGTYRPIVTLSDAGGSIVSTTSANTATLYAGTDVSSKVSITRSGAIKNRTTGLYYSTVTINNISGVALTGDIDFVLLNLTAGVTLTNATGTTAGGTNPWIRFSTTGLAAGKSLSLSLSFSLANGVTAFNYSYRTYTL